MKNRVAIAMFLLACLPVAAKGDLIATAGGYTIGPLGEKQAEVKFAEAETQASSQSIAFRAAIPHCTRSTRCTWRPASSAAAARLMARSRRVCRAELGFERSPTLLSLLFSAFCACPSPTQASSCRTHFRSVQPLISRSICHWPPPSSPQADRRIPPITVDPLTLMRK